MPFIPHTEQDIQAMLSDLEYTSIDDVWQDIPKYLAKASLDDFPESINEMQLTELFNKAQNNLPLSKCFLGGGCYAHFIPACIWDLLSRSEFYSAYTPYQAEASQGTLTLMYQFQQNMNAIMQMQVSNASLYDSATAIVEAIWMALRVHPKQAKHIYVSAALNPRDIETIQSHARINDIAIEIIPTDLTTGLIDAQFLQTNPDDVAAVVIAQPNYFGNLEAVDTLADHIHSLGALCIGVVNPLAMAMLKPPGKWGSSGCDIVCGELGPLGIPMQAGGPRSGFLSCKQAFLRQLPGRLAACTTDSHGNDAYTLTLQTREQHIRREKATSNICTNQSLIMAAANLFMRYYGGRGLANIAQTCHNQAAKLCRDLTQKTKMQPLSTNGFFHEFIFRLPTGTPAALIAFAQSMDIQAGIAIEHDFPGYQNCLLVAVTETKTNQDIDDYVNMCNAYLTNHA